MDPDESVDGVTIKGDGLGSGWPLPGPSASTLLP